MQNDVQHSQEESTEMSMTEVIEAMGGSDMAGHVCADLLHPLLVDDTFNDEEKKAIKSALAVIEAEDGAKVDFNVEILTVLMTAALKHMEHSETLQTCINMLITFLEFGDSDNEDLDDISHLITGDSHPIDLLRMAKVIPYDETGYNELEDDEEDMVESRAPYVLEEDKNHSF